MTSEEQDLTKISLIRIVGELSKCLTDFRAHNTREKNIRVELSNDLDLVALRKLKSLCGHDITVQVSSTSRHTSNTLQSRTISWGKIFSHELFLCTDDEILSQLQSENEHILSAKRIHRTSERIPTRLIKIKFDRPTIPDKIYCLNSAYDLEIFIPPPKKCMKCKEYGHWRDDCKNNWKCNRCGKNHDERIECHDQLNCVSCGLGHGSDDRNCPKHLKEKEVIEISYVQNISYPQARTIQASYASILRGGQSAPRTDDSSTLHLAPPPQPSTNQQQNSQHSAIQHQQPSIHHP